MMAALSPTEKVQNSGGQRHNCSRSFPRCAPWTSSVRLRAADDGGRLAICHTSFAVRSLDLPLPTTVSSSSSNQP